MRLPHSLLESQFFTLTTASDLVSALGAYASEDERCEISRLTNLGLPPVSSHLALSAMLGINPGLLWSFVNRTARHYRHFTIPKGRGVRCISAPRVGLKVIQKWLSVHLQRVWSPHDHVFGFVPGRSHLQAANKHVKARWVVSVDISNFFPSTPSSTVEDALRRVGYGPASVDLIARLITLGGVLPQGAPTSPVISNIAFFEMDKVLASLAERYSVRVTRYADDIVFSGTDQRPGGLLEDALSLLDGSPWNFSQSKTEVSELPSRLKVHGLLVHGNHVRLTKGYRNKLRAMRHLYDTGQVSEVDIAKVKGHLRYFDQVMNI